MRIPTSTCGALLALLFPACAAAPARAPVQDSGQETPFPRNPHEDFWSDLQKERAQLGAWMPGQVLAQGFIGVGYPDDLTFDTSGGSVEIEEDELENLPVIGGGIQLKLAGEYVDFGVEGLLSFAFRSDVVAFAAGGSGGFVAVDVDVYVFDFFGGPFLSKAIGERTRIYAAAGPIMRYLEYSEDEDETDTEADDETGFGAGVYARGGIEFLLPSGTLVGFGTRWSSAEVDLGDDFGDADLEDFQALITVSRWW